MRAGREERRSPFAFDRGFHVDAKTEPMFRYCLEWRPQTRRKNLSPDRIRPELLLRRRRARRRRRRRTTGQQPRRASSTGGFYAPGRAHWVAEENEPRTDASVLRARRHVGAAVQGRDSATTSTTSNDRTSRGRRGASRASTFVTTDWWPAAEAARARSRTAGDARLRRKGARRRHLDGAPSREARPPPSQDRRPRRPLLQDA